MQKITGVGGVLFKARDPEALRHLYEEHLGVSFQHGYVEFTGSGTTVLNIVKEDSDLFEPSRKDFLLNFRVTDLKALLAELKEKGVTILGDVEQYDFGSFGRILDPEGNKIELCEPKRTERNGLSQRIIGKKKSDKKERRDFSRRVDRLPTFLRQPFNCFCHF